MTKRAFSLVLSLLMIMCALSVTTAQAAPVVSVESLKITPYMGSFGEIKLKVTGATNVTYQWQAGYYDSAHAPVDLDDNEYYIGTKTNHFKILASGELDTLEFRCKITYDGGSTYSQIFHFTFLDPKVISRAYVVGVDAPVFGCGPKYRTDDIQSEQYDLDSMVWYGPINDSSAPLMESTDVYLAGKYKCRFYLNPAEGYVFNENSDCSVDGIICKVYSEKSDDGTTAYYADRVYTVSFKGTVPDGILDFEWKIPSDTSPNVNLGNAYLGTDTMDIPFAFKIKDLPRSMALADYTVYGSTYIQRDGESLYSVHTGDRVNLKDVATVPGKYHIYHELFLLDPEGNEITTKSVYYFVDVWIPIYIMDLSVDVDEPVAGLNAEIAFKNKTNGCVVNNMYWYDITDGERVLLKETDTFEAGRTYQVEVWLEANDGYYMNTDKEGCLNIKARINGKPAEVLLAYSDKEAGFTLDFTIPGEITQETTNPSDPTDPTEATTESAVATEPTEATTESAVATDPTEATTESAVATDPTEATTESAVATDPAEATTESLVATDPTKSSDTTEPSTGDDTKPSETTEPSTGDDTKPSDTTEPSTGDDTKPSDTTEPSTGNDTKPSDTTEPSTGDDTKPSDTTEPSTGGDTKPSYTTEPSTGDYTTPSEPVVDKGILGDVDGNGKVNIKDATMIQKFAAKIIDLTDDEKLRADVNTDAKVNIKDATAIQKIVAKIETGYPIGKPIQ